MRMRQRARLRPGGAHHVLERLRPRVRRAAMSSSACSSRSATGSSRSIAAWRLAAQLGQPHAQAVLAVAAADVDPLRELAPLSTRSPGRRRRAPRAGGPCRSSGRGSRSAGSCAAAAARARRRASSSCPSPTGRRRTCGGRSRRRRARTGRRAPAAARRPAAGRGRSRRRRATPHLLRRRRADRRVVERSRRRRRGRRPRRAPRGSRACCGPRARRRSPPSRAPPRRPAGGAATAPAPAARPSSVSIISVAARRELEPERRLELEATAVERAGHREDLPLELGAQLAVLLEVAPDHAGTALRSWNPRTTEITPRTMNAIPISSASVFRLTSGRARMKPPSTTSTSAVSSRNARPWTLGERADEVHDAGHDEPDAEHDQHGEQALAGALHHDEAGHDPEQAEHGGEHARRRVAVAAEGVDEAHRSQQQQVDAGDQRQREQRDVRVDQGEDAGDRAEHAGDDEQRADLANVMADFRGAGGRGGGHGPMLRPGGVSERHTARVISSDSPGSSTATRTSGASRAACSTNSFSGSPVCWCPIRR